MTQEPSGAINSNNAFKKNDRAHRHSEVKLMHHYPTKLAIGSTK